MDRALVPENVEIHQPALQYMEESRAFHILKRWVDGGTMGVVSGLTVTVNTGNATLIDIAAGHGYTPSGELVELPASISGISLSNYAAGLDNYVCLVYTETQTHPEATATGGKTAATRAARSYRVRVFTRIELNALVATSTDMNVDARDRTMVIAVVNANGPSVALTSTDITTSATFTRMLSIVQPSTMTGVEIIEIDPATATTAERIAAGDLINQNAQLQMVITFTHPSPPSSITLAYKAPGDSTFGGAVVVNAGGSPFTLTSSGGRTIRVGVSISALPSSGFPSSPATITESLAVTAFYTETLQRASAKDEHHRRTLGAVVPTVSNAHGLKLKNLGGATQELLGTTFLGTGLESTFAQTLVPRLYSNVPAIVSGAEITQRTYLWQIVLSNSGVSPPLVVRFYGTTSSSLGFSGLEITINARWAHNASAGSKQWVSDNVLFPAVLFSVGSNAGPDSGVNVFSRVSTASPWTDGDWRGTIVTSAVLNRTMFNGYLDVGRDNLGTSAGIHTPRIEAFYSTTASMKYTLLLRSSPFVVGGNPTLRIYSSQSTGGAYNFVITWNARWDQTLFAGAGGWVADQAGVTSTQFVVTQTSWAHQWKTAGSGSWAEFDWSLVTQSIGGVSNYFAANGDVTVIPSTSNFTYGSTRTGRRQILPNTAVFLNGSVGPIVNGHTIFKAVAVGGFALFWPLDVPNGATITKVQVFGDFTIVSGGLFMELFRASTSVGVVSMNSGGPTSLSSGTDITVDIPANQNNVVDYSNFCYFLEMFSEGAMNNGFTIERLMVEYTATKVAP